MPVKFVKETAKNPRNSLKYLLKTLKPFRLTIIVAITFAILSTILALLSPKILGDMTNSAVASISETGKLNLAPIKTSAIQLIVIYLVSGLLGYLQSYLLGKMTAY